MEKQPTSRHIILLRHISLGAFPVSNLSYSLLLASTITTWQVKLLGKLGSPAIFFIKTHGEGISFSLSLSVILCKNQAVGA